MTRLDQIMLALHVFSVIGWVGGLTLVTGLLAAYGSEPDAGAKQRLAAMAKKRCIGMDAAAAMALVFGLHWLIKFDLYKQPYMHIKLTLVAILFGLHGMVRVGAKRANTPEGWQLPKWLVPLSVALGLGIVVFVILKVPTRS
jgi:uncharacterized membrane protein